ARQLVGREYRLPARFLGLETVAIALDMFFTYSRGDAIGKVTQALAQCHRPQACALSTPVKQGMERGAQPPAHRGRDTDQLVREFVERVTQAIAQACPRKQRPHTAHRAVKAVSQSTLHAV